MALISFPVGLTTREITTPSRANGARITMTRDTWGTSREPLFDWRVFERERNGSLTLLVDWQHELAEQGVFKDGTLGAPLVITLSWQIDKDKDLIRIELDVFQAFQSNVTLVWL